MAKVIIIKRTSKEEFDTEIKNFRSYEKALEYVQECVNNTEHNCGLYGFPHKENEYENDECKMFRVEYIDVEETTDSGVEYTVIYEFIITKK